MEIGTVTDTGRYGYDGLAHQPADDAGQGTFHAGDNEDHVGLAAILRPAEQPVNTGDAHIVNAHDFISHDFSRKSGFF